MVNISPWALGCDPRPRWGAAKGGV